MKVKKFLAGMLSVSMLSMMCAGTLTASADLIGDVDGSGHVNPGDCIEILNANTGMKELTCDEAVADVNLDSVINECDAAAIAAYYMADIDKLPAEAPLTDEPVDPFPHTFSFSMSTVTGYTGTTVPVQIYLDQSKDYAWLFEFDAMRLSVAADAAVRISSVQMNANFWIGNPDKGVISGAYVKHEDSTRPVATVYVELPTDMAPGVYSVDFVTEDCFIGNMFGQIADEVSFTGGTIVVEAAPETIATTTTTTTEMTATTTTGVTETDFPEQTDFPDETEVPDTTIVPNTTPEPETTVFTEDQVITTTAAPGTFDEGIQIFLSDDDLHYELGAPLCLDNIGASVYSETDGWVVYMEDIVDSKYFIVDDSRYNPDEAGIHPVYVYYTDGDSIRQMAVINVTVFAETAEETQFTGETTTTSVWTTTRMTHITSNTTTTTTVDETAVETEQTTIPAEDMWEMDIDHFGKGDYWIGEELDLSDIYASVFIVDEGGFVVSDEPITNSEYFTVDDSEFDSSAPGVYTIYVYYVEKPYMYTSFDVQVYGEDDIESEGTTMTTDMTWHTTLPTTETTITTTAGPEEETTETPADTTYFDPAGTVETMETTIVTTWNTTLATTETTVAYTTNVYTDEDGVVCFEYCADIGDTIPVDEIYAGLPYVITEECASYENGIITAISAGEFCMDFFASDALTEKVAHVRVHIFAEPDEEPETEPVWTETTSVTTWHTGLHTTDMTTTTIASTLDENGNVIYGTTMPADTTPSGSDSEEEPIATTTSETSDDGTGTDWVGSEEVNGTTAVASDAETTETTASEADTEDTTTTEPEENLPQTGNPAWFGWMIALTATLITAGGWMMMQSGMFKKDEE